MSASPIPASSSSSATATTSTQADAQIVCKWKDCGLLFDDAETIYKHLCEDHVGRKSTGNLCLQCKWEGCEAASAAKRHHITSHLIVHTPFKPHSCSHCNKTFKRPQDLKKHERIHDSSTSRKAANSTTPQDIYSQASYHEMQLQAAQRASAMYAAQHGPHSMPPHLQLAGYPPVSYPQVKREHTPNYGEASSSASLSPLSSHLGTPANGNSPSVYPHQYTNGSYISQPYHHPQYSSHQLHQFQQQQQQQHLYQMNAGSYMGLVPPPMMKQEITPQHQPHPNDAYPFLGQGTHLAGSKRGYEEMLVGDFADDVRKKRVTTNYNEDMVARLDSISHYSNRIDDTTISSLFTNVTPGWSSNAEDGSRNGQMPFSDNLRNTDLAQLNSFLIQLGANVARDDIKQEETSNSSSASSSSQSQPALSPNSHSSASSHAASSPESSASAPDFHQKPEIHFDLSGLNGIQGFDESLLQGVNWSSSGHEGSHQHHDDFFNPQNLAPRPIAHLPTRSSNQHAQQSVMFNQGQSGSNYTHSSYPQSGFGSLQQNPPTSFDSIRTSRGPSLVPQLAQPDSVNHNYRKVEALQRAAPIVGSRGPANLSSDSGKAAATEAPVDEDMEEADGKIHLPPLESATSYRQRSASPAVSEASSRTTSSASSPPPLSHGLYPRMTSLGDPSRKLPTPMTTSGSGPSISSILASSTDSPSSLAHQRSGSYTYRNASNIRTGNEVRYRAQPEDNASDDTGASTPLGSTRSRSGSYGQESPAISASSRIYPSLASDSMEVDEVHNEMSNLDLANSKVILTTETRKRHLDLIRRLLIAINYPRQQRKQQGKDGDGSSASDSDSDSSVERALPPMKTDNQLAQQDPSPLPGIDALLKAGHRRSSSKSHPHPQQHNQRMPDRLPSFRSLQESSERSSITQGRLDGVDI